MSNRKPVTQSARNILIDIYLDFKNDYLSPEYYAARNGLTETQAQALIALARQVYYSSHPES